MKKRLSWTCNYIMSQKFIYISSQPLCSLCASLSFSVILILGILWLPRDWILLRGSAPFSFWSDHVLPPGEESERRLFSPSSYQTGPCQQQSGRISVMGVAYGWPWRVRFVEICEEKSPVHSECPDGPWHLCFGLYIVELTQSWKVAEALGFIDIARMSRHCATEYEGAPRR